jgi:hypothetical protein
MDFQRTASDVDHGFLGCVSCSLLCTYQQLGKTYHLHLQTKIIYSSKTSVTIYKNKVQQPTAQLHCYCSYTKNQQPLYLSLFWPCSRDCLMAFTVCNLLLTSGRVLGISRHSFTLSLVRSTQSWHS